MPVKRKINSVTGKEAAEIPAKKTRTAQLSADGKDDPATPLKQTRKAQSSADGKEDPAIPLKQMVWLPTECWADCFKFLSRRDLLRSVQPACSRFHSIAEKHVDNVHIVRNFTRFADKIRDNGAETNRQLLEAMESSSASLAKHFRLFGTVDFSSHKSLRCLKSEEEYWCRYSAQMIMLRNSMELFRGCKLELSMGSLGYPGTGPLNPPENVGKNPFVPTLALFQSARPCYIGIGYFLENVRWLRKFMNACELLVVPTVLNCMRLIFMNFDVSTVAKVGQLLEHLPSDAGGDDPNTTTTTTTTNRTFRSVILRNVRRNFCTKLIERCKKNLLKAKGAADVRAFVVVFHPLFFAKFEPFRLDHSATGEVLQLEQVEPNFLHDPTYVLRRCLAGDLATMEQFCLGTFTWNWKTFKLPLQRGGIEPPKIVIY